MKTRTLLPLAALAALVAAPVVARAQSVSLEAYGGYQNLNLSTKSFENAVSGKEGTALVGGQLLAGLGPLGVGVSADKSVTGSSQPWTGSLLAGFLMPLSVVRLEILGELGRRSNNFGDIFSSNSETIVGVRPGVSFRIAPTNFIIGVSGIGRWSTSHGDIGTGTYGIVGRVGVGTF